MSFGKEYFQDFQIYSFFITFFQQMCIVFNMSHTLLSAEGIKMKLVVAVYRGYQDKLCNITILKMSFVFNKCPCNFM